MLHDMEAADARGKLPSDDEAADWAVAEPAGGHGGRLRFGGGTLQQQPHLVRMMDCSDAPVRMLYGSCLPSAHVFCSQLSTMPVQEYGGLQCWINTFMSSRCKVILGAGGGEK